MKKLLTLLTLVMLLALPYGAWAEYDGKIVYVSDKDGNQEIYLMNLDGTGKRNISNNSALDLDPRWSPDGKKISFYSNRSGEGDIFIADLQTLDLRNVTNDPARVYCEQDWSPDSRKLIVKTYSLTGTDLYTINVNGTQLTKVNRDTGSHRLPRWSPAGDKIAYDTATTILPNRAYIMDIEGTNVIPLDEDSTNHRWSPDGSKILYTVRNEIWVADADGENKTRVTYKAALLSYPTWSPDGTKIAFFSQKDAYFVQESAIYIANADGSDLQADLQRVSNFLVYPKNLEWSPDGKYLLYSEEDPNSKYRICLLDISGEIDLLSLNLEELTSGGNNTRGSFQPVAEAEEYIVGDANGDGQVDIGDSIKILMYVFRGDTNMRLEAADCNGSGNVDMFDAVYLLRYLFSNGPAPVR